MGASYAREALRDLGLEGKVSYLKVGFVYPISPRAALAMMQSCNRVLVVEDGEPLVETQLRTLAQQHGLKVEILGKMGDARLSPYGELKVDPVRRAVAAFAGLSISPDPARQRAKAEIAPLITPRSSTLCAGCPHLGTYWALRRAMKLGPKDVPVVNVDIGCYEQAGYGQEPYPHPTDVPSQRYRSNVLYNFLDTCYVMGSSISMALGQELAKYRGGQVVAVAGDSTFFHACMPALANAAWNGTKLTFVVVDNSWTAMTGHQPCPVTGRTGMGKQAAPIEIAAVSRALGAGLVQVADAYDVKATEGILRRALDYDGVAVVVSKGECVLQLTRRGVRKPKYVVDREACTGCTLCVQLGCPAVTYSDKRAGIDPLLCVGCSLCAQTCPSGAISPEEAR
jgi:indolepyruvate ferredoxin oxidoreductase alpha subunit